MKTLIDIWLPQGAKYYCLATRRDGTEWRDHFFTPDEFDDLENWVSDYRRHDIYFCPHGMQRRSRQELYASRSKLLWADLDAVNPRVVPVRPSVAWETSRGRYSALWKLDDEPTRELRRGFNRMLACADPGWHLGKVLRLWGTKNYKKKYVPTPTVKLLWANGVTYGVAQLNKYAVEDDGGGDGEGRLLSIDGLSGEAVCAKYKWDKSVMLVEPEYKGRSLQIWDLGRLFKRLGATPDEIGAVLWDSRVWQSKYRHMSKPAALQALSKEVGRMMTKK